MMKGQLKVFCVGSEWFLREMVSQEIDAEKVDWTPPIEVPEDISRILQVVGG